MDNWGVSNAMMSVRFPYEVGNVVAMRGVVANQVGFWLQEVGVVQCSIFVPN